MKVLLFLTVLSFLCPLHLLTPVSIGSESEQQVSDEVKELESLRTPKNSSPNVTEAKLSEASPLEEARSALPHNHEEPPSNSRSAIFRHRVVNPAKKSNKYWKEKMHQPVEAAPKYNGIQYSPHELAAYVFQTGDEEGVALAVEELVREGIMGRTDAINYLQDVKQILMYLREQYENQKKLEEFKSRAYSKIQLDEPRFHFGSRNPYLSEREAEKRSAETTTGASPQVEMASTPGPSSSTTGRPEEDKSNDSKDEETKKSQSVGYPNSFTLRVIYKLAKDMFAQSIVRDDPTAEDTLTGLVSFLESEVGNKRISEEMKEKVLEVVSAALVDSLREFQRHISESDLYLYQHLARPSGPNGPEVPVSEMLRNLNAEGREKMMQVPNNKRPNSS